MPSTNTGNPLGPRNPNTTMEERMDALHETVSQIAEAKGYSSASEYADAIRAENAEKAAAKAQEEAAQAQAEAAQAQAAAEAAAPTPVAPYGAEEAEAESPTPLLDESLENGEEAPESLAEKYNTEVGAEPEEEEEEPLLTRKDLPFIRNPKRWRDGVEGTIGAARGELDERGQHRWEDRDNGDGTITPAEFVVWEDTENRLFAIRDYLTHPTYESAEFIQELEQETANIDGSYAQLISYFDKNYADSEHFQAIHDSLIEERNMATRYYNSLKDLNEYYSYYDDDKKVDVNDAKYYNKVGLDTPEEIQADIDNYEYLIGVKKQQLYENTISGQYAPGELDEQREEIAKYEAKVIELRGEDGNGGKLALAKQVHDDLETENANLEIARKYLFAYSEDENGNPTFHVPTADDWQSWYVTLNKELELAEKAGNTAEEDRINKEIAYVWENAKVQTKQDLQAKYLDRDENGYVISDDDLIARINELSPSTAVKAKAQETTVPTRTEAEINAEILSLDPEKDRDKIADLREELKSLANPLTVVEDLEEEEETPKELSAAEKWELENLQFILEQRQMDEKYQEYASQYGEQAAIKWYEEASKKYEDALKGYKAHAVESAPEGSKEPAAFANARAIFQGAVEEQWGKPLEEAEKELAWAKAYYENQVIFDADFEKSVDNGRKNAPDLTELQTAFTTAKKPSLFDTEGSERKGVLAGLGIEGQEATDLIYMLDALGTSAKDFIPRTPKTTEGEEATHMFAFGDTARLWTQAELDVYYSIYDKYGIIEATRYAAQVNSLIGSEYHNKVRQNMADAALYEATSDKARYMANALASPWFTNPLNITALGDFVANSSQIRRIGADIVSPNFSIYELSNMAQEIASSTVQATSSPIASFLYNAYSSAVGSIESAAIGGAIGSGVSTALGIGSEAMIFGDSVTQAIARGYTSLSFFSSAAVSSYNEFRERGVEPDKAWQAAFASGLAEAFFEDISFDKIYDAVRGGTVFKDFGAYVGNALVSSGIEASEELFTEMANFITENAILNKNSKYWISVNNYHEQGLNYADAMKKALGDEAKEWALAAASGFVSSFGSAGVPSFVNYAQFAKQTKEQAKTFGERIVNGGEQARALGKKIGEFYSDFQLTTDNESGKLTKEQQKNLNTLHSLAIKAKEGTATAEELGQIILLAKRLDEKSYYDFVRDNVGAWLEVSNGDVSAAQRDALIAIIGEENYDAYIQAVLDSRGESVIEDDFVTGLRQTVEGVSHEDALKIENALGLVLTGTKTRNESQIRSLVHDTFSNDAVKTYVLSYISDKVQKYNQPVGNKRQRYVLSSRDSESAVRPWLFTTTEATVNTGDFEQTLVNVWSGVRETEDTLNLMNQAREREEYNRVQSAYSETSIRRASRQTDGIENFRDDSDMISLFGKEYTRKDFIESIGKGTNPITGESFKSGGTPTKEQANTFFDNILRNNLRRDAFSQYVDASARMKNYDAWRSSVNNNTTGESTNGRTGIRVSEASGRNVGSGQSGVGGAVGESHAAGLGPTGTVHTEGSVGAGGTAQEVDLGAVSKDGKEKITLKGDIVIDTSGMTAEDIAARDDLSQDLKDAITQAMDVGVGRVVIVKGDITNANGTPLDGYFGATKVKGKSLFTIAVAANDQMTGVANTFRHETMHYLISKMDAKTKRAFLSVVLETAFAGRSDLYEKLFDIYTTRAYGREYGKDHIKDGILTLNKDIISAIDEEMVCDLFGGITIWANRSKESGIGEFYADAFQRLNKLVEDTGLFDYVKSKWSKTERTGKSRLDISEFKGSQKAAFGVRWNGRKIELPFTKRELRGQMLAFRHDIQSLSDEEFAKLEQRINNTKTEPGTRQYQLYTAAAIELIAEHERRAEESKQETPTDTTEETAEATETTEEKKAPTERIAVNNETVETDEDFQAVLNALMKLKNKESFYFNCKGRQFVVTVNESRDWGSVYRIGLTTDGQLWRAINLGQAATAQEAVDFIRERVNMVSGEEARNTSEAQTEQTTEAQAEKTPAEPVAEEAPKKKTTKKKSEKKTGKKENASEKGQTPATPAVDVQADPNREYTAEDVQKEIPLNATATEYKKSQKRAMRVEDRSWDDTILNSNGDEVTRALFVSRMMNGYRGEDGAFKLRDRLSAGKALDMFDRTFGSQNEGKYSVSETADEAYDKLFDIAAVDNTSSTVYNETNGGVSNDTGRSNETDYRGVSPVLGDSEGNAEGRRGPSGVSVDSGIVRLSDKAIQTIQNSGVEYVEVHETTTDNAAFSLALSRAKEADQAHGWAVSSKRAEDLDNYGTRTFMNADNTVGFAVATDGDIEAVFKLKGQGPRMATLTTIPMAIANGGTKLDCYGPGLARLYAQYGLIPVARTSFSVEIATEEDDGWTPDKGTPDIYFMMVNGDPVDTIVENAVNAIVNKQGGYHVPTIEELEALPLRDYDVAGDMRDKALAELLASKRSDEAQADQTIGKYSITNIESDTKDYGPGVLFDSSAFNSNTDWVDIANAFVESKAGQTIIAHDIDTDEDVVLRIADRSARHRKGNNPQSTSTLGELKINANDVERNVGRNKSRFLIHLPEVVQVVHSDHPFTRPQGPSHGYIDRNGWRYYRVYGMDTDGNIYTAFLNIAQGDLGDTLYTITAYPKPIDRNTTFKGEIKNEPLGASNSSMTSAEPTGMATSRDSGNNITQTDENVKSENVNTGEEEAEAIESKYSLLGPKARGADLGNLDKAMRMELDGESPSDIWIETGWVRLPDGNWRWELYDKDFGIDEDIIATERNVAKQPKILRRATSNYYTLEAILTNADELFDNYPELRYLGFYFADLDKNTYGVHRASEQAIVLNRNLLNRPIREIDSIIDQVRSTLMHEVQHAIQSREGFASGSSDSWWSSFIDEFGEEVEDPSTRGRKQVEFYQDSMSVDDFLQLSDAYAAMTAKRDFPEKIDAKNMSSMTAGELQDIMFKLEESEIGVRTEYNIVTPDYARMQAEALLINLYDELEAELVDIENANSELDAQQAEDAIYLHDFLESYIKGYNTRLSVKDLLRIRNTIGNMIEDFFGPISDLDTQILTDEDSLFVALEVAAKLSEAVENGDLQEDELAFVDETGERVKKAEVVSWLKEQVSDYNEEVKNGESYDKRLDSAIKKFGLGTVADFFNASKAGEYFNEIDRSDYGAYDYYYATHGEKEARMVQDRLNRSRQYRRQHVPQVSGDVVFTGVNDFGHAESKYAIKDDYGIDLDTATTEELDAAEARINEDHEKLSAQEKEIQSGWRSQDYENLPSEEFWERYHEWNVRSGIDEVRNRKDRLTNYLRQIRKEKDWRAIDPVALIDKAKELFGTTDDYRKSGYILPDGTLLDMSEGHEKRTMFHQDAAQEVLRSLKLPVSDSIDKFVGRGGAIRIDLESDGIDIPQRGMTQEQYATLRTFLENYIASPDYTRNKFYVMDLGKKASTSGVFNPSNTNQIINGIRQYYREGDFPQQSETSQFYSKYAVADANHNDWAPEFYSKMQQTIEDWTGGNGQKLGSKMAANSVVSWLKGKGVKDEEIKWSGIKQYLEGRRSVTQEELLQVMAENEFDIRTKVLSQGEVKPYFTSIFYGEIYETEDELIEGMRRDAEHEGLDPDSLSFEDEETLDGERLITVHAKTYSGETKELDSFTQNVSSLTDETNWSSYTLKGGRNYREILFQNPESDYYNSAMRTHWKSEAPGTIAHARVQDMTDENGDTVLFVEEIQSDWHNAGASNGFYQELTPEQQRYIELRDASHDADEDLIDFRREHAELLDDLEYRIELRQEKIRRLAGADTADKRARLSVRGWLKRGSRLFGGTGLKLLDPADIKRAEDYIYSFLALSDNDRKILDKYREKYAAANEANKKATDAYVPLPEDGLARDIPFAGSADTYHEYVMKHLIRLAAEGDYEKIGWTTADQQSKRWSSAYAEGYRIEYDQNIPKFMRKYVKQWGATVGSTVLENGEEVWSVDITPQMREDVLTVGQPKYSITETAEEISEDYYIEPSDSDLADILDYLTPEEIAILERELGWQETSSATEASEEYEEYEEPEEEEQEEPEEELPTEERRPSRRVENGVRNPTAFLKQETLNKWLSGSGFASPSPKNYAQAYIGWMHPDDFLFLSTGSYESEDLKRAEGYYGDEEEISRRAQTGRSADAIHLTIDHETGRLYGHEGRHRMDFLQRLGVENVPVLFFDDSNKYDKEVMHNPTLIGEWNPRRRITLDTDLIPLNENNRAIIEAEFVNGEGEDTSKPTVRFSITVDPTATFDAFGDEVTIDDYNPTVTQSDLSEKLYYSEDGNTAYYQTGSGETVVLNNVGTDSPEARYIEYLEAINNANNTNTTATEPYTIPPATRNEANGYNLGQPDVSLRRGTEEVPETNQEGTLRRAGSTPELYGQSGPQSEETESVEDKFSITVSDVFENEKGDPDRYIRDENGDVITTASAYPIQSIERFFFDAMQREDFSDIEKVVQEAVDSGYSVGDDEFDLLNRMIAENENATPEQKEALRQAAEEARAKYGTLKQKGTKGYDHTIPAKTEVNGEERTTRGFVGTVASNTDERMNDELTNKVMTEEIYGYTPQSNEETLKKAREILRTQYNGNLDKAINHIADLVESGQLPTAADIALGEILITELSADTSDELGMAKAVKVTADLAVLGTNLGQAVQAMSMIRKMTPRGQLYYLQGVVKQLNRQFANRFDELKHPPVRINDALALQLMAATTREEMNTAIELIKDDLARQVPVTIADKWNAWRYLAMLGNPRTHFRNIFGNAVFMPAVFIKDTILRGLQQNERYIDPSARTMSKVDLSGWWSGKTGDNPYINYALKDFELMSDVAKGKKVGNKYADINDILSRRKVFGIEGLDWLNELNSTLLENEDLAFMQRYYVRYMAEFLQTKGIKAEDLNKFSTTPEGKALLNQARAWAMQQAHRNTYHEMNTWAMALNKLKHSSGAAYTLMDGVVPFVGTPANILKLAVVNYSPYGLIKSGIQLKRSLEKGDRQNTMKILDGLASGLTGTGIMVLGALLARFGLFGFKLRGAGPDDDKEAQFERLMGHQQWSMEGHGLSYTLDWAAPMSLPLFTGVTFYEMFSREHPFANPDELWSALIGLANPMLSMSMLDGLESTLSALTYSEEGSRISALLGAALTSHVAQAFPTLFGQVNRIIDPVQRTTYNDKNNPMPGALQKFIQQNVYSKVPGLSFLKNEYVDEWGRTNTSTNLLGRVFSNFVSPGYFKYINETPVDTELMRLNKALGGTEGTSVLPGWAAKSVGKQDIGKDEEGNVITIDGKDFTGKEYEKYAKVVGQNRYALLSEIMGTLEYQAATDTEKAKMINDAYEYARSLGRQAIIPERKMDSSWMETAKRMGAVDYIVMRQEYENNKNNDRIYSWVVNNPNLTTDQMAVLFADKLSTPEYINSNDVTGYRYKMLNSDDQPLHDMYEIALQEGLSKLYNDQSFISADMDERADRLREVVDTAKSQAFADYSDYISTTDRVFTIGKASSLGKEKFEVMLDSYDGDYRKQAEWITKSYKPSKTIDNPDHAGYELELTDQERAQSGWLYKTVNERFADAYEDMWKNNKKFKDAVARNDKEAMAAMAGDLYNTITDEAELEYGRMLNQSGTATEVFKETPTGYSTDEAYKIAREHFGDDYDAIGKYVAQTIDNHTTIPDPDNPGHIFVLDEADQIQGKRDRAEMFTEVLKANRTKLEQESDAHRIVTFKTLVHEVDTAYQEQYARKLKENGYAKDTVNLNKANVGKFLEHMSKSDYTKEQVVDIMTQEYIKNHDLDDVNYNDEAQNIRFDAARAFFEANYEKYIKTGSYAEWEQFRKDGSTTANKAATGKYGKRKLGDIPGPDVKVSDINSNFSSNTGTVMSPNDFWARLIRR